MATPAGARCPSAWPTNLPQHSVTQPDIFVPMRRLAPAGTRVTPVDIMRWLAPETGSEKEKRSLSKRIACSYEISQSFTVSSGRAALCLILRAMRKISASHKTEVILPSYTCYSLPACVVRSGLKIRIIDVHPRTLRMNLHSLRNTDMTNVLAVIPTSLYGIPEDFYAIEQVLNSADVFLIDDAAQAMGAMIGDRYLGTFGDAGVFSFDKGKTLTSIQGGAAVTNSMDLGESIKRLWLELPRPQISESIGQIAQTIGYALFLNPYFYALPDSLPFLALGQTRYQTDFPETRYPRLQEKFAAVLFHRIDEIIKQRRINATRLIERVESIRGISTIEGPLGAAPTYVRLPLIFDDAVQRTNALNCLLKQGLGASPSYPKSVADVVEIKAHMSGPAESEQGRIAADRIITLPTHGYVRESDIDRIAETIRRAISSSNSVQSGTAC